MYRVHAEWTAGWLGQHLARGTDGDRCGHTVAAQLFLQVCLIQLGTNDPCPPRGLTGEGTESDGRREVGG